MEIDRSPLILLLHQVRISAIEGIIQLVRTRQRIDINRFQQFQRLFVAAFLHQQHALHEVHFIGEGSIRILLQVGLQVTR